MKIWEFDKPRRLRRASQCRYHQPGIRFATSDFTEPTASMPMQKSRAAIFDLDGTLVDAFADIAAALNAPLTARGFPPHSIDTIRGMVGDGAGKLVERATAGIDPDVVEDIHKEMMEHYHADPANQAKVYPGVFELLGDLLDWGIRLGVLSNKPHPMTVKTCEQMGLSKYFDEIVGESGAENPRKPDPAGLRAMIQRMNADKVVYIGDGNADGQVTANANVPFIACLWGTRDRAQLAEYNPIAFAETPSELHALILDALS